MARSGVQRFGPETVSLLVRTFREGMAAKLGHDLVLEVTRWEATVDGEAGSIGLTADPGSLEVREGVGGAKPLTDSDRAEIRRTIDRKVLRGRPIVFRSSAIRGEGDRLVVEGELTLAGTTRPVAFELATGDGIAGTVTLSQTAWGIEPYRGLMGALKVRDDVEVVAASRAPTLQ